MWGISSVPVYQRGQSKKKEDGRGEMGGGTGKRQGEGIRHTAALDRVHRGHTNTERGKDIN